MPFPSVDALLEAANKTVCAALMAIYAWSPLVATLLNLLIFAACLWTYRWASRRVAYMRAMVFDPVWAMFRPEYGKPTTESLTVFSHDDFASFPARAKLTLQKEESGWTLTQKKWFVAPKKVALGSAENQLSIEKGLFVNKLVVAGPESGNFHFTRRFNDHLPALAGRVGVGYDVAEPRAEKATVSNLEMS